MSAASPITSTPCVRVAVQSAAYETIGHHQYITEKGIRLSILIRVHPSLDLQPFFNPAPLHQDLAQASLTITIEGQDSLEHIGNIVAQYLTRKTVQYATGPTSAESDPDPDPSTLREHLPPILVQRSSLLFAVRAWPGEKASLLLADEILVDDMMILQDWHCGDEEITKPGQLTLYCILASVRVLVDRVGVFN